MDEKSFWSWTGLDVVGTAVYDGVSGVGNFVADTVGGSMDGVFGIVDSGLNIVGNAATGVIGVADHLVGTGFAVTLPNGTTIGGSGDNSASLGLFGDSSTILYIGLAIVGAKLLKIF